MTLDAYSPCPGGTGKKIKFCCADLVHELDKLQRMIDGDQRVAALDYVTKLDAKYPGRACLLSSRATLEGLLGNREQSAATLSAFREKYPDNPTALAELAVLQSTGETPAEAIRTLEKALALCTSEIPQALYDAYGAVAESMIELGQVPAAEALLLFQASMSQGSDKEVLHKWAMIEADPTIPLLMKVSGEVQPAPAGAPWKYEFDRALEPAHRGQWHAAAEKFAALIPIAGKSPALWQNLLKLRLWVGDTAGAIEALRRMAALDIPLDDAVEAEATALVFESQQRALEGGDLPPSPSDQIKLTFKVTDQAKLEERFTADKHFDRLPFDPQMWGAAAQEANDNEPPPRACYALLDKPLPASADIKRDEVPLILATMFFFGRQTDRPERLEAVGARSDIPAARDLLTRLAGDSLGESTEEVIRRTASSELGAPPMMRFPDGMPPQRRIEIDREETERRMLEVWPDIPLSQLDGKTLREASGDPAWRNRAMGILLLLDGPNAPGESQRMLDQLRQLLGLPIPRPIDPATVNLKELPRTHLARLQADKLSDEQLIACFKRARLPRQLRALEVFAKEIVARPSLAGREEVPEAYNIILARTTDINAALQLVEQGRVAAQRLKQSTVPWDLAELRLRIERGEQQEASRVLRHLEREHGREPGVAEALFRVLYEYGMIDEHGRPVARSAPQSSPLVVPGAAAPGKILVPGGEAAAASESAKPVIWTPGMD